MSGRSSQGRSAANGGKRAARKPPARKSPTRKPSTRKSPPRKRAGRRRASPPPRRWRRRLIVLLLLIVVAAVGLGWAYRHHVVLHPGEHLERDHILAVISQETPVYYRDGETKIGVFFDENHRQYVPYDEIPEDFVRALVAAEDQRFFEHPGVDVRGLTRAVLHNLQARRLVEGGSTLTQQTAENLFFAQRALTLPDKAREAVDALRLEYHYTKEDILEFYANQFYVNGNGRGLGIAARYFFDKPVTELDTLECVFLAGVVQSPSRFDPFLADTPEGREQARQKAHDRVAYVLARMTDEGYLDADRAAALAETDIPFERGRFRYPYDVVLDAVARELGSEQLLSVLEQHGIDNPSTAGIRIVSSVDASIQIEALYGLRHHLTEIGIPLEAVTLAQVLRDGGDLRPVPASALRVHTFHEGRVRSVDPEARRIVVDLGGDEWGVVDAEGCARLATALERAAGANRWAEASRAETTALLREIPAGRGLWVSVRADGDGERLLDVEYATELEGAVVVLDDGRIRAMVGGTRNRDFNRATQARRQFGSTFKPLVYFAALQLGWTPTDALDNRREVFPFEGSYYFPRPDHTGAPEQVSLAWAGVTSENVASVWLLYHLTDHLNDAQFAEVARLAGLTRGPDESREAYIERIRDREGVVPTEDRLREGLFDRVREDVEVDLLFDGREEQAAALRRIHYGRGFAGQRRRTDDRAQRAILTRSLLHLQDRAGDCAERIQPLRAWSLQGGALPRLGSGLSWGVLDGQRTLSCGDGGEGWVPLERRHLEQAAETGRVAELLTDDRVVVEGQLSLATLSEIHAEIDRRLPTVTDGDLYDHGTLALLRDYRTLVHMRYVLALARELGVETELATGLSLPLGSSDIGLIELALIYQGLRDGQAIEFEGGGSRRRTSVIEEIRLRDGTVIHRAEPVRRVLVEGAAAAEVSEILRNVVIHGTGKSAARELPGVPLAGKTGTTNRYRNAAFAGIVPRATDDGWSLADGMVVASYVGYDDNRKMSRGSIRLAGATGSLPAWLGAARGVLAVTGAGSDGPPPDALVLGEGLAAVAVDPSSGLPLADGEQGATLYTAERKGGSFAPFRPGR